MPAPSFSSTSLYQKYRPMQLSDMVGQEGVVKVLSRATEGRQFTHAYLFGGQRGSGKTSAARILAATMVCPEPAADGKPCGTCRVCTGIHDGHCVDIYEMDGADKSKVEDIRRVIETCHYAPQELKRKVYIIDESHMLSNAASNALLKTLEEPPGYVNFILCTTEVSRLIPTIVSRCTIRLNFNRIPYRDIAKRLMAVASRESIKLEELASLAIARASRGSMRDAFGDLERISMAEGGNVTMDAAMSQLGTADGRVIYHIVKMMAEDNAPAAFADVDGLIKSSVEAKVVLHELCEVFRIMVVMASCGRNSELLDLMDDEKDVLDQVLKKISLSKAVYISNKMAGLGKDFSSNIHERLVLEAAVIQGLRYIKGDIGCNTQKQS